MRSGRPRVLGLMTVGPTVREVKGGRGVTVGQPAPRSHPGVATAAGEVSVCAIGKQGLRVYLRGERQMSWICFRSER